VGYLEKQKLWVQFLGFADDVKNLGVVNIEKSFLGKVFPAENLPEGFRLRLAWPGTVDYFLFYEINGSSITCFRKLFTKINGLWYNLTDHVFEAPKQGIKIFS